MFVYFSSLHVSGIHVPIIRRVTVSVQHWYLSLCMGGVWSAGWIEIQLTDQTPPIRSDKYQRRIDAVIFS